LPIYLSINSGIYHGKRIFDRLDMGNNVCVFDGLDYLPFELLSQRMTFSDAPITGHKKVHDQELARCSLP
jgi:hypothetical protein